MTYHTVYSGNNGGVELDEDDLYSDYDSSEEDSSTSSSEEDLSSDEDSSSSEGDSSSEETDSAEDFRIGDHGYGSNSGQRRRNYQERIRYRGRDGYGSMIL